MLAAIGIDWLGFDTLARRQSFGFGLPDITRGALWSIGVQHRGLRHLLPGAPRDADRAPAGERLRLAGHAGHGADLPALAHGRHGGRAAPDRRALSRRRNRRRRSFEAFARSRGLTLEPGREADIHLLRYAEHLLASAIGAASSRLVLSLLLRRRNVTKKAALKLLDDASAAIQYNRDLLQHALDHARQGITVFDKDLRLMCLEP